MRKALLTAPIEGSKVVERVEIQEIERVSLAWWRPRML